MRKLFARFIFGSALCCAASLSCVAHAQNSQTSQRQNGQAQSGQSQSGQTRSGQNQTGQSSQFGQTSGTQGTQQGSLNQGQQGQRSDQEIAACIYLEANNEIEISKLGEQRAQSHEVKEFAQQMVRDHSPGAQEMQRLAGNLLSEAQPQRSAQGGLDWVAIKKQIGQQCLASTRQELSQKSAEEFDRCFMGQQIVAHMKVVDELKVLRNYASDHLRQSLDKELQTAQHHLQMAKQIEQGLDKNERTARRAGNQTGGRTENK